MSNKVNKKRQLRIDGQYAHPYREVFDALEREHVDHVGNATNLSRFNDGEFQSIYAHMY